MKNTRKRKGAFFLKQQTKKRKRENDTSAARSFRLQGLLLEEYVKEPRWSVRDFASVPCLNQNRRTEAKRAYKKKPF